MVLEEMKLSKFFTFCSKSIVMRRSIFFIQFCLIIFSCNQSKQKIPGGGNMPVSEYFNYGDTGVQTGGVRMIPIKTPVGEFKVWTKRFGNNPKIKILLLHGGPACST